MHNDLKISSSNNDISLYRISLLIIIFSSLTTALTGIFTNNPIFDVPLLVGSFIFFSNTFIALSLYYFSLKNENHTSLYFGLSMLLTGIATYITGINEQGGIFIIIVSLIFMLICSITNKSKYVL